MRLWQTSTLRKAVAQTENYCQRCGKAFRYKGKGPRSLFCSSICHGRWWYYKNRKLSTGHLLHCRDEHCHNFFVGRATRWYCSQECLVRSRSARWRRRHRDPDRRTTCRRCSKPLTGRQRVFCSIFCGAKVHNGQRPHAPPELLHCAHPDCQNFFVRRSTAQYCSKFCTTRAMYLKGRRRFFAQFPAEVVEVFKLTSILRKELGYGLRPKKTKFEYERDYEQRNQKHQRPAENLDTDH